MSDGNITIDTTNETATVKFYDDHQNPTSAPEGVTVAFSSSDETVLTVAADPENPLQADITPVGLGTATVAATFNGSAMDANTNQPIADPPASDPITVSAGPAAGAAFVLSV
jgi:hypothetical protein